MFSEIRQTSNATKVGTAITSAAVATGIVIGVVKKKGFWGTVAWAMGLGLAGVAVSTALAQISKK